MRAHGPQRYPGLRTTYLATTVTKPSAPTEFCQSHAQPTLAAGVFPAACTGVFLGVILAIFVLASGSTFGQRCASLGFRPGTQGHASCVSGLAGGADRPRAEAR